MKILNMMMLASTIVTHIHTTKPDSLHSHAYVQVLNLYPNRRFHLIIDDRKNKTSTLKAFLI